MSASVVVNQPGVFLVDANGNEMAASNGQALGSAKSVAVAGLDTSTLRMLAVDGSGRLRVVGVAAEAAAAAGDPLRIAGWDDSSLARTLRTNSLGAIRTDEWEDATYSLCATAIAPGNNKSMLSLVNAAGSGLTLKLDRIGIRNAQATAVTGVMLTLEWRRCTGHSAGTDLSANIQRLDSADAANSASVTARTGATIAGESTALQERWLWSSDEYGSGTLDQEGLDHALQNLTDHYGHAWRGSRPFTLRAGEGTTIKCATNSTVGAFDFVLQWRAV